jgi:hypothetical protein
MIGNVDPTVCIKGDRGRKIELCSCRRSVGHTNSGAGQGEYLAGGKDQTDFVVKGVGHDEITVAGDGKTIRRIEFCRGALPIEVPLSTSSNRAYNSGSRDRPNGVV